jgi:diaminopimelate epimerase
MSSMTTTTTLPTMPRSDDPTPGTRRSLTLEKHHGLGNDFLVAFDPPVAETELPALARRVCDRRRGVGADGLLVATESAEMRDQGYDARMVLYNADGSRAEMSGNGIRCFAQALARRRGHLDAQRILTDAGARSVVLSATDRADTVEASVEMGAIGTLPEPEGWGDLGAHPDRPVAHLDLGNPHSVVGVDDVLAVDLVALGGKVPHVNLEIVEPGPEPHGITMRVHERGVGVTDACGTGACASAWAAVQWGLVAASAREIVVHMDGGSAKVSVNHPVDGAVTLTGPAIHVATIEIEIT